MFCEETDNAIQVSLNKKQFKIQYYYRINYYIIIYYSQLTNKEFLQKIIKIKNKEKLISTAAIF